ncbi:VOC family protein [Bacillus sp. 31A1R]|uniref:VOC family protein n=1 Tax=Robertmurraya mangrovi TaxID=3098077 RepID=A0ABU5J4Z4_9BACI|nr:VOC family protein [Bacillus sp. 31A1R]MDZ5474495.1 VOC family protein [Bacillus sp. 31A1R]
MKQAKLYEAHLMTSDLERSIQFYKRLGFTLDYVIEERRVAFFFLGDVESKENLLGIWETDKEVPRRHIAFSISLDDLKNSIDWLKEKGIKAEESFGLPGTEPMVHAWMPAASVYFSDPDGNSLEYISVLENPPRRELGVVQLSEWEELNK